MSSTSSCSPVYVVPQEKLLLHGQAVVEQAVMVQPAAEGFPHQLSLMQLEG